MLSMFFKKWAESYEKPAASSKLLAVSFNLYVMGFEMYAACPRIGVKFGRFFRFIQKSVRFLGFK